MTSREHNKVVKALRKLAKAYGEYTKVEWDKPVFHNYKPDLCYVPDLWAETKRGKIDVYEVWYGQSDDEAIADIFWSALIPKIRYLCIVCVNKPDKYTDPWTEKGAKELFSTVSKHIYKDNKRAYDYIRPYTVEVTEEELRDDERLKKYLNKKLEFG